MIAQCIICDGAITLANDVQKSEVITCGECKSRLVVEKVDDQGVVLAKAPEVEEDWGE